MGKTITVHIDKTLAGRKIENVLEKHLLLSRSLIAKMKRTDGAILFNGQSEKVILTVNEGDVLTVNIPEKETRVESKKIPLEILFEDEEILAINKPWGIPVHPSKNHVTDTLANGIKYYLGENSALHIITRLDRETSGVVLVAKNARSAKILTEQMKNGNIQKEYIAAVNGSIEHPEGVIDVPIDRDTGIKRKASENGKSAVTEYEVIKSGDISTVRLFPKTGRTHQIRVHLSYIGNPIFGDSMYGAPQKGERCRLHCRSLEFTHPEKGEKIFITAKLPDDMHF